MIHENIRNTKNKITGISTITEIRAEYPAPISPKEVVNGTIVIASPKNRTKIIVATYSCFCTAKKRDDAEPEIALSTP